MGQRLLSDEDIKSIASDPNFTDADLRLLSPTERQMLDTYKRSQTVTGRVTDVAKGVAKGAGQTAFNLGKMVHNTPGLGQLTDSLSKMLGGTDPDAAFGSNPGDLEATNTAQKVGKGAEQAAEFFVPAGPARAASIEKIVSMLPNAMKNPALLNKIAAIAGRMLGEGASATAVSSLHGNEAPQTEGAMAAAGPLVGAGAEAVMGPAAKFVTGNKYGQEMLGIGAGMLGTGVMGVTPLGLGAAMGTYGLSKRMARDASKKLTPTIIRKGSQMARKTIEGGARTAAAVNSGRPSRKRLEQ